MIVLSPPWTNVAGILWWLRVRSPRKKNKKDKHGVGLQAKTVAQAMRRHWLTNFDIPAVIFSDRGSQFLGSWFKSMCEHTAI